MGINYWKNRLEGKCGQCGKERDREDRVHCKRCRDKFAEQTRNKYYRDKEEFMRRQRDQG